MSLTHAAVSAAPSGAIQADWYFAGQTSIRLSLWIHPYRSQEER